MGYRPTHSEVFSDCRKSLETSLLTAGVFGGEFIVGEEAVISADGGSDGAAGYPRGLTWLLTVSMPINCST